MCRRCDKSNEGIFVAMGILRYLLASLRSHKSPPEKQGSAHAPTKRTTHNHWYKHNTRTQTPQKHQSNSRQYLDNELGRGSFSFTSRCPMGLHKSFNAKSIRTAKRQQYSRCNNDNNIQSNNEIAIQTSQY